MLFVRKSDGGRVRENIIAKNIYAKNIYAKNIFKKNIFAKNIVEKNIFKKKLMPNIFPKKKVEAKPPCCPQGLG